MRAEDLVRDCLARIDAREADVQAWTHVARDAALAHARVLDQGAHQGLLHGLPIGVKDLIATADMPTTYGSPIYAGHQPANDASCVALARALAVGTSLLLLDEPFEGVAPALSKRLGEVIAGLKGSDVSVLIAQSDLNHSRKLVDREFVIERGANLDKIS